MADKTEPMTDAEKMKEMGRLTARFYFEFFQGVLEEADRQPLTRHDDDLNKRALVTGISNVGLNIAQTKALFEVDPEMAGKIDKVFGASEKV